MKYVYDYMVKQFNQIGNNKELLLIPLGKAVEEVLIQLVKEDIIEDNQIVYHFPHPSGANVNRLKQFAKYKENMIKQIELFKK